MGWARDTIILWIVIKLFLLKFYFHFIPLILGYFRIRLDGLFHLGLYRVLAMSRKKSDTRLMPDIITQFQISQNCFIKKNIFLFKNLKTKLEIKNPKIFLKKRGDKSISFNRTERQKNSHIVIFWQDKLKKDLTKIKLRLKSKRDQNWKN
jgi:hypothetical protein